MISSCSVALAILSDEMHVLEEHEDEGGSVAIGVVDVILIKNRRKFKYKCTGRGDFIHSSTG